MSMLSIPRRAGFIFTATSCFYFLLPLSSCFRCFPYFLWFLCFLCFLRLWFPSLHNQPVA
jgi:hypothetical protein